MRDALRGVLLAALVAALPALAPAVAVAGPAATPAPSSVQEAGDTPSPDGDSAASHPGEELRVYLLTMGRGDVVWEKFGHNAIRIVDDRAGTDVSWNWGIFDFTQENFWPRLVTGDMLYSMGVFETDASLRAYAAVDRPVWQQELALTPDQKLRLREAIHEHWRPENRDYHYDYYRDNCSTRVRDMLDLATGGALSRTLRADTTATTFRWHTRRLLGDAAAPYLGIQLVLGQRADRPITAWEETFLPMKLQAHLREVTVAGPGGVAVPLVREEGLLVRADRPAAPESPPSPLPWFLSAGVALALLPVLLAPRVEEGSGAARVALALLAGGWSLAAGVAGALVLGAWLFTRHVFWGVNENLLQASPLSLLVAVAVVPLLWRRRPPRLAVAAAWAVAALSALGFLLQALPGLDQTNGEIIALALPVNVALALVLARLIGPGSPVEPERPVEPTAPPP